MFENYEKMTEEELMKKLSQINERLVYFRNSGYVAVNQLLLMQQLVTQELTDRGARRSMQAKIDSEPAVRDLCAEKKKEIAADKNSRAKTQSDIIGRMRRTTRPTTIKDAE